MKIPIPADCAARFVPERLIASGGFGAVYLATQKELGRKVAIKLLLASAMEDPEQVRRFIAEARITASLDNPHIVKIFDHGAADGVPWIDYEYLQGPPLRAILGQRRRVDEREVLLIGIQVATALEAAHARSVLHRDIKPENILEASPVQYKVTDFGIARWRGDGAVKTKTGLILGTPAYIPPEIVKGQEYGEGADLYSLGVMLFELATGQLPFEDTNLARLLNKHLGQTPPGPRELNPALSRGFERFLLTALEKDPGRRHGSASEFRLVLEKLQGDRDAPEGGPVHGTISVERGSREAPRRLATTRVRTDQAGPPGRAPRGPVVVVAVTLAVAAALGLGVFTRPRPVPRDDLEGWVRQTALFCMALEKKNLEARAHGAGKPGKRARLGRRATAVGEELEQQALAGTATSTDPLVILGDSDARFESRLRARVQEFQDRCGALTGQRIPRELECQLWSVGASLLGEGCRASKEAIVKPLTSLGALPSLARHWGPHYLLAEWSNLADSPSEVLQSLDQALELFESAHDPAALHRSSCCQGLWLSMAQHRLVGAIQRMMAKKPLVVADCRAEFGHLERFTELLEAGRLELAAVSQPFQEAGLGLIERLVQGIQKRLDAATQDAKNPLIHDLSEEKMGKSGADFLGGLVSKRRFVEACLAEGRPQRAELEALRREVGPLLRVWRLPAFMLSMRRLDTHRTFGDCDNVYQLLRAGFVLGLWDVGRLKQETLWAQGRFGDRSLLALRFRVRLGEVMKWSVKERRDAAAQEAEELRRLALSSLMDHEVPIRVAALDDRESRRLLARLAAMNRILSYVFKTDRSPAAALAIANRCEELCPPHLVPAGEIKKEMDTVRYWKAQALAHAKTIEEPKPQGDRAASR
ncbi:MAG: serine/threonine protein kinase [Candidatus Riflebacteria bacterium]|nr:serine/threonine protein kinase [Candidatus Riflebacteria bacterium]